MDLYGPIPSSEHVVVVQDLTSRYPTTKLVSSTAADRVITVMADNIMTPVKSQQYNFLMVCHHVIAKNHRIRIEPAAPYHPNLNLAETFMKTLGQATKIGHKIRRMEQPT